MQPVLSLDLWPVLLWGFSFREGRQLGELRGGWWTAGPICGERGKEREREASESMRERDERGKGESVYWGEKKEKRKEKERAGEVTGGLCSSFTSLSSLLLCVSLGIRMTHSFTHRQTFGLWESTGRVSWRTPSLCLCCFVTTKNGWGQGMWIILLSPNTWVGGYGNNPRKLTLDTRLQNTEIQDSLGRFGHGSGKSLVTWNNLGRYRDDTSFSVSSKLHVFYLQFIL